MIEKLKSDCIEYENNISILTREFNQKEQELEVLIS